jgi:hypothetical protein
MYNIKYKLLKRVSVSFPFIFMYFNSAVLLSVFAGTQKCVTIRNGKLKDTAALQLLITQPKIAKFISKKRLAF